MRPAACGWRCRSQSPPPEQPEFTGQQDQSQQQRQSRQAIHQGQLDGRLPGHRRLDAGLRRAATPLAGQQAQGWCRQPRGNRRDTPGIGGQQPIKQLRLFGRQGSGRLVAQGLKVGADLGGLTLEIKQERPLQPLRRGRLLVGGDRLRLGGHHLKKRGLGIGPHQNRPQGSGQGRLGQQGQLQLSNGQIATD